MKSSPPWACGAATRRLLVQELRHAVLRCRSMVELMGVILSLRSGASPTGFVNFWTFERLSCLKAMLYEYTIR
jgi:hypothetical protein